nr:MauE/DoxX family redox-associated membrane protein [Syntrophales bacterium]
MEENRKKIRVQATLYHAARWILGIVFVYASIHKILYPAAFAKAVYLYQILPDWLVNLAALVLPWLELFLSVSLILRLWMPGTVVISSI